MQLLKLHVSASVSSFFLSLSFSAFQPLQHYSLLYKVHKYNGKLGKEPVVVRDLIGQTIVSIKNEACTLYNYIFGQISRNRSCSIKVGMFLLN